MTDDPRPLLVFFWSERSGPARRMESLLAHLARKERARLRVRRVDVDASPEIAARFKVETIPTLVRPSMRATAFLSFTSTSVGIVSTLKLSLIHISEPTRPY